MVLLARDFTARTYRTEINCKFPKMNKLYAYKWTQIRKTQESETQCNEDIYNLYYLPDIIFLWLYSPIQALAAST
jgi:hypothetical protein